MNKNNSTSNGANYLGLAFQMGIIIFLATYGGIKLDKITGNHHIFTILLSLLSIILMLYYIIHKETRKKKK
ncbi:MAG: AtpZ/AtpI family protein [Bacteroidales bacterium]|jgi:membrane protein DedA with SNARE-associated domain|nr:AtpZ/AtpI family protein [Bacteroidales bacterium]